VSSGAPHRSFKPGNKREYRFKLWGLRKDFLPFLENIPKISLKCGFNFVEAFRTWELGILLVQKEKGGFVLVCVLLAVDDDVSAAERNLSCGCPDLSPDCSDRIKDCDGNCISRAWSIQVTICDVDSKLAVSYGTY